MSLDNPSRSQLREMIRLAYELFIDLEGRDGVCAWCCIEDGSGGHEEQCQSFFFQNQAKIYLGATKGYCTCYHGPGVHGIDTRQRPGWTGCGMCDCEALEVQNA
jgi:hypothetical protein